MKNKLSPEANISTAPGTRRSTALSHLRPIPRRGLSRVESAIYVGVSPTLFDRGIFGRSTKRSKPCRMSMEAKAATLNTQLGR
jgi:hypothetical protein